jgi:hypothetical protein
MEREFGKKPEHDGSDKLKREDQTDQSGREHYGEESQNPSRQSQQSGQGGQGQAEQSQRGGLTQGGSDINPRRETDEESAVNPDVDDIENWEDEDEGLESGRDMS